MNGQGETEIAELTNAAEVLQELVWSVVARGKELPEPREPSSAELARGRVALLQITMRADTVDFAGV